MVPPASHADAAAPPSRGNGGRSAGLRGSGTEKAHGRVVHPDDVGRFAELGVVADISPTFWLPGITAEAIRIYTTASVTGMRLDDVTGTLSVGESADLVMLSKNPWQIPVEELPGVVVQQTSLVGKRG